MKIDARILMLLEKDCRYTAQQIAAMLDMEEADVAAAINQYQNDKIIMGYNALIDWDRTDEDRVTAMIEVKITPQQGDGFDKIASNIYQYEEVESVYLMSGGYDVVVIISGRSLKEVGLFVSQKLSPIDGVIGTSTHFILKKYKERHSMFKYRTEQEERLLYI